ncbi:MAG: T9SS type A sorting domain-containing protein [Lentimicrobium sp.]|jgi:hypothetical protein|nr:T9SS type A sorting domain-containing protein [Lentimicrobium sp.]
MKRITCFTLFLVFFTTALFAQKSTSLERANKYLAEKGEVIFTFKATSQSQFFELNEILSVSHRRVDQKNLEVEAYANKTQFEKFLTYGLPFNVTAADNEIAQEIRTKKNGKIASTWDTAWDSYPQYSEYVAKMNYWANTYPNLCTLQNIGTTPNGRALYVLKISDNASTDETEPEFLYTSSMHGDEITGYPTMLHLIDYLLTNYGSLSEVTNLVNGTEIYICPLANPDGSYKTAGNDILNSTGNTATRANANGVDLNRNYPDPIGGIHPDGLAYQPETLAFLSFEQTRNFVLAANYHGGAEVVNFPWDTSTSATGASAVSIHPHDSYFRYISQEYAQSAQTVDGNLGYLDDVYGTGQFPGTTNGAIWYTVKGGRQDNNNFYNHNKEMTIEISATKFPLASTLLFYWDRNKQALLNLVKQASYGLQGIVTDASGNPIHAKVYIAGTLDNSGAWVETSATKGDYHKVQIAGTYNVIFEAPGYATQTISATITNGVATNLNVIMIPTTSLPTASSDVTICQGQTATLTATGSGTIKWYDSATATTAVGTGTSFTTPILNATTSYFAESEVTPANVGPTTATGTSSTNTAVANRYLIFNCTAPTKLKSVLVNASAIGQILVELQDSTGKMLESKVVRLTASGSQDIDLNFFLPVATGLRLVSRQISSTNLVVATSGIIYPLTNGTVSITANSGSGTFLPFFNWKFAPAKGLRDEVIVAVKPIATLASITPTTIASGGSDFALTVNGTNFVNGESIVRWNGTNRATTFVSSTELSAAIPAADIATGGTASITVFNSCGTTTSQTITFVSVCAPVADVTVLPTITGQCSATATAPTATSSCTGAAIGTTATVFPITTQGTTIVTWTYNDGNGNTSTQNQTVIVDDTVAPVADVTTLANATGQTTVTVTAPTATDACVGTIIGTTPSPLTYSTQGTFAIVWTYNDGNGNTATQNQTVIVADTIVPTAPTSLVASGTTSTTTTLSWTASTDNAAVTGYDVYNGATLLGTTSSTSYTVSGLTASTAYTFSVKAKDAVGNISTSSNIVNVTTLAPAYCTSQGTSVASETIGKVVFGTINNTTTGGTGYVNYTAISTNATRGTVYTITITPSWTSTKRKEGYAVWIDYNGDGDFADAGEQVWTKAASTTTPVSGTFTIPATATVGATRMRVSMKYNAIPTMCETFASGQVEDYTVNIVSTVAKIANPSGKAITEIKLYPNPTTSILNVSSVSENAIFKVYNMLGQAIMNGKLSNGSIDVSNISAGIYVLEVTDKESTSVNRFIKQ